MDTDALNKLSAEQLAALNDEQRAIFCSLDERDQIFFTEAFNPKDLPTALLRKGEIMQRNQASKERMENIYKQIAQSSAATPASSQSVEGVLTAVAGVVGIGAAAAMVASDNKASWRGLKPADLIAPLRTEFDNSHTRVNVEGNPNALAATVAILANSGLVPALTIHLTAVDDGTEVTMSDLTSQGTIETLKEGGQKILDIAGNALHVLARSKWGGVSPDDLIYTANHTLAQGASLAEVAGNLKLKDRAWKVIKQTAESIEVNYQSEAAKAQQMRFALEKAWDNYNNCPTCGVAFAPNDTECRVCGSGRPEKPAVPDPRQP